ncbi:hypothetical protein PYCCODRAFT_466847 [Trametes coccinea BRFM310]|uniref:Uncharacterized protein n=1 Tax=Trametes coccinea (strain BRFM310) TaxID=1353009 RepID=A0A1Y2INA2_TRAC3|nr:hypothetical protein PYCCODRAFT_466847 [Trametes coccinea BRFM310]
MIEKASLCSLRLLVPIPSSRRSACLCWSSRALTVWSRNSPAQTRSRACMYSRGHFPMPCSPAILLPRSSRARAVLLPSLCCPRCAALPLQVLVRLRFHSCALRFALLLLCTPTW